MTPRPASLASAAGTLDRRAALCGAASLLPWPTRAAANAVDCLLILAVDVSASMSAGAQHVQREGTARAVTDPAVIRAVRGGPLGRIGLMLVEWASQDEQRITVPWTLVDGEGSAAGFAARLAAQPPVSWRQTSISGALLFCASQFASSPFAAPRRVIDVSGDGPNNDGAPVGEVRDALIASGIVVNGLPIVTPQEPALAEHYRAEVIGGPGAFVLPVDDIGEFREALARKLVLELA